MNTFADSAAAAWQLVVSADPLLWALAGRQRNGLPAVLRLRPAARGLAGRGALPRPRTAADPAEHAAGAAFGGGGAGDLPAAVAFGPARLPGLAVLVQGHGAG